MLALEERPQVQELKLVAVGLGLSRGSQSDGHSDDLGDKDDDEDDDDDDDWIGAVAWLTI